jgi:hypothetical protein
MFDIRHKSKRFQSITGPTLLESLASWNLARCCFLAGFKVSKPPSTVRHPDLPAQTDMRAFSLVENATEELSISPKELKP